jgi:hypothetical protein
MNKLQEKANELIAIAQSYGIECETTGANPDYALKVKYKVGGLFYSVISRDHLGEINITNWDKSDGRLNRVFSPFLKQYFEHYAKLEKENA